MAFEFLVPRAGAKPVPPALGAQSRNHWLISQCQSFSCVQLFVMLWTVALQVPLSKGLPRQEYWSGQPFPSPGDLLNQGSDPGTLHCRQILYHLSHQESPLYTGPPGKSLLGPVLGELFQWIQLRGTFFGLHYQGIPQHCFFVFFFLMIKYIMSSQ